MLLTLLVSNSIWSNFYYHDIKQADDVAELEIKIKEKTIESMSKLIFKCYKNSNRHDLAERLKADFNTDEISIDGDWLYFESIKFQFIEDELVNVY